MMNKGKRFENNFKASVPSNCWYYRLRDSAASYYGGNQNLRFSSKNIADSLVYSGNKLYICELKAHAGKSIPLTCIRENQAKMMLKSSAYENIQCLLFVFFYDVSKCYALNIKDFDKFIKETDRKSIPISYFEENGIDIPVKQLKTNQRFDLSLFN